MEVKMSKDEFKDSLFDLLNESDDIPIKDLTLDDRNNTINLVLTDDTMFLIHVSEPYQTI
jgi:hypothetical protein